MPIPEAIRVTGVNYSTGTLTVERFNEHLKEIFSYSSGEKTLIVSENEYNRYKKIAK